MKTIQENILETEFIPILKKHIKKKVREGQRQDVAKGQGEGKGKDVGEDVGKGEGKGEGEDVEKGERTMSVVSMNIMNHLLYEEIEMMEEIGNNIYTFFENDESMQMYHIPGMIRIIHDIMYFHLTMDREDMLVFINDFILMLVESGLLTLPIELKKESFEKLVAFSILLLDQDNKICKTCHEKKCICCRLNCVIS